MTYSCRNHITQILSRTGSAIATDEKVIDDLVGKVFDFLQVNPGGYSPTATARVLADNGHI